MHYNMSMAVLQIRSAQEIRISAAELRSRLEVFVRNPRPIRHPGPGGCECYTNFRIPNDLLAEASRIAGMPKTAVARALALEGPSQSASKIPSPPIARVPGASPRPVPRLIPSHPPQARNATVPQPASSHASGETGETVAEVTRRHVERLRAEGWSWTIDDCGNAYRTIRPDET
jgi:hypothetical protein